MHNAYFYINLTKLINASNLIIYLNFVSLWSEKNYFINNKNKNIS